MLLPVLVDPLKSPNVCFVLVSPGTLCFLNSHGEQHTVPTTAFPPNQKAVVTQLPP